MKGVFGSVNALSQNIGQQAGGKPGEQTTGKTLRTHEGGMWCDWKERPHTEDVAARSSGGDACQGDRDKAAGLPFE